MRAAPGEAERRGVVEEVGGEGALVRAGLQARSLGRVRRGSR